MRRERFPDTHTRTVNCPECGGSGIRAGEIECFDCGGEGQWEEEALTPAERLARKAREVVMGERQPEKPRKAA